MAVRNRMRRKETAFFYAFISPWLIGFILLSIGPIIASFFISFTSWNIFQPPTWVGLKNYTTLFQTPLFYTSLDNTLIYALVTTPLGILIGLAVAVLLNQKIVFRNFFRVAFILPSTLPVVAVTMLWSWLLAPAGLFNEVLQLFGIKGPAWFVDPAWMKPGLILFTLWTAGGGFVLFLAGLQGVPDYLYEAAELDGADAFTKFRHITMPMLSPIVLFNLVTGIIGSMQTFTQVYILGSSNSLLMMVVYLFQNAFQNFSMGFASAIAWVLFVIIMLFSLLVFRWSSMWVYYEGEIKR